MSESPVPKQSGREQQRANAVAAAERRAAGPNYWGKKVPTGMHAEKPAPRRPRYEHIETVEGEDEEEEDSGPYDDEDDDNEVVEEEYDEPPRVRRIRRIQRPIPQTRIVYARRRQPPPPRTVHAAVQAEDWDSCLCDRWCRGGRKYFVNCGCCTCWFACSAFIIGVLMYYSTALIRSIAAH